MRTEAIGKMGVVAKAPRAGNVRERVPFEHRIEEVPANAFQPLVIDIFHERLAMWREHSGQRTARPAEIRSDPLDRELRIAQMLSDVAMHPLAPQLAFLHRPERNFMPKRDIQQRGEMLSQSLCMGGADVGQLIREADGRREEQPSGAAGSGESPARRLCREEIRRNVFPAERQNQTFGPLSAGDGVRVIRTCRHPTSRLQRNHATRQLQYAGAADLQDDVYIRPGHAAEASWIIYNTMRARADPADRKPGDTGVLQRTVPGGIFEMLPGEYGAATRAPGSRSGNDIPRREGKSAYRAYGARDDFRVHRYPTHFSRHTPDVRCILSPPRNTTLDPVLDTKPVSLVPKAAR